MFIVLSEIDTLDYLHRHGIYPNEFYTDLVHFKENAIHFNDAFILVIFAGVTNFRKRNVCAEINHLRDRAKDKRDTGITGVVVVSDTTLSIQNYYMYSRNLNWVDLKSAYTVLQKHISFFDALKKALGDNNVEGVECVRKEIKDVETVRDRLETTLKENVHKDEIEYRKKIKQFNVRQEVLDSIGTKQ